MSFVTVLLLSIHIFNIQSFLIPTDSIKHPINLESCIHIIIKTFIEDINLKPFIFIINDDSSQEEAILLRTQWPRLLKNVRNPIKKEIGSTKNKGHYVMIPQNIEHLQELVDYINRDSSMWENIRFLIIALNVKDQNDFVMRATNLLKMEDINGIILTKNAFEEENYDCYVFKNVNCYYYSCEWNLLSKRNLNFCQNGLLAYNKNTTQFKNSIANRVFSVIANNIEPNVINLQNGTLSGPTALNYGVEHNILNLIAEILNISFVYYTTESGMWPGDAYDNGTIAGLLNKLEEKTADIAIGAYIWTSRRSARFYPVFLFVENKFGWFVPYVLEDVYNISFDWLVFNMFLISFIALTLIQYLFNVLRSKCVNFDRILFLVFSALINIPTVTKGGPITKSIWIIVLFLNLFLSMTLYTFLTSFLAGLTQDYKYNTMEKILSSNLTIRVQEVLIPDFSDRPFYNRIVDCKIRYDCIKSVATEKNSTYGFNHLIPELIINKFAIENEQQINYVKYPVNFPLVIYLRHGFPYYRRILFRILNIVEEGFIHKFIADLKDKKFKKIKKSENELKFKHFKPIFLFYLTLCCFNIVVFICEIVVYRVNYLIQKEFYIYYL